ncbi:CPBP family intramembrane glutamic endopeptidase [uncultured Polaribacter sp.]|uniref:CPBP family intramembrane glutamic endopeptidase n=1 Tax=uncultured Polaribacter sp. TaxID=174711 RepID=UPI0026249F04|nr:CPBP family intramembrane glutamic endopeptidase [uncultured Polaribacter sp.]
MKETFLNLIDYIKNPINLEDTNTDTKYRFKIFLHLLVISIATGLVISPIFVILDEIGFVNMDNHKIDEMFKNLSLFQILLTGGIVAPVIEELIFRAPITTFKKPTSFKIAFYVFAVLFGLVHISNFEITTNVLIATPLLVLPQIILGTYFGYIRVKFGLIWSMLLHGSYNSILMVIGFVFE